jgi:superfamily II DNA or RNA helicase
VDLRPYQVEAANWVIARKGDLCIIAPTGSGKSLVWALPLLEQKDGISLVIVPFTSLGHQGELRRCDTIVNLEHITAY